MKIFSKAFENGGYIPAKYSKKGGNISPTLSISGVPINAKSLAIICHDPDAPVEGGFTHWVVWNINPNITEVAEGSVPTGAVQGLNDWRTHNWGGPQPPSGVHHYNFHLYALDEILNLSSNTNRPEFERNIQNNIIETSLLVGLYSA